MEEYRAETKIIESELSEFLYDFPYERKSDIEKVF